MSEPAAPRISASHDTPGNARVVAVADDLLLVADSDALLVLRERRKRGLPRRQEAGGRREPDGYAAFRSARCRPGLMPSIAEDGEAHR